MLDPFTLPTGPFIVESTMTGLCHGPTADVMMLRIFFPLEWLIYGL